MNTDPFIASLKPGDLVCTNKKPYTPIEVIRVTPTGRVVLANGSQFDPDGTMRGERGKTWYGHSQPTRLERGDPASILSRMVHAARIKLKWFDWGKLSDDVVLELAETIDRAQKQ